MSESELILGMLVIDESSSGFSLLDARGSQRERSGQDVVNLFLGWHVNGAALVSPGAKAA